MSLKIQRFADVFDAFCTNPEEARDLKNRSDLMIKILQHIEQQRLTVAEAAHELGISRPQIVALKRGHIDKFSVEELTKIHAACEKGAAR